MTLREIFLEKGLVIMQTDNKALPRRTPLCRKGILLLLRLTTLTLLLATTLACSRGDNSNSRFAPQASYPERTTMTLSAKQGQSNIVSWNAWSRQFIDPPEFRLLPSPGLRAYRAVVTQGEKTWCVESPHPYLSLEPWWSEVAASTFTLTFEWIDAEGMVTGNETSTRVKAPEWAGFNEEPEDWGAAADRNMAYLIDLAWKGPAPYKEPGTPIIIWSVASPTNENTARDMGGDYWNYPDGFPLGYPCLAIGSYIPAFLAYAKRNEAQAPEALRLARACADWALRNRFADEGALPLFPYTTVNNGKFGGFVEGGSTHAMRACYLAAAFVDIYEATSKPEYLDYARHIADTIIRLQRPDGSFPYRVNPKTGAVTDAYAPDAVQLALLVDALEPHGYSASRRLAAQRAIDWMMAYVCGTNHWQAAFEDVFGTAPFVNLSQHQAIPLIRYLCRHKDENPSYLPMARKLNRWVEDQFVMFASDSKAFNRPVKTPMVFEQFFCWYPMEAHNASWIQALLDLHRASGDREYLDKAQAAANALCAQQYDNGAFSTWGIRHYENGRLVPDKDPGFNWYNCNAHADWGLYALDDYVRSLR